VEFVSDRMSYMILRGRWCNIIVLNVHDPTEDKIDDIKDRFYEELEQVLHDKQRNKTSLTSLSNNFDRVQIQSLIVAIRALRSVDLPSRQSYCVSQSLLVI
jgi:hypothetical protein